MPKPTIRQTYIAGLESLGATKIQTRASKYEVYKVPTFDFNGRPVYFDGYVYLGRAGAFRVGSTVRKSVDRSTSLIARHILRLGAAKLQASSIGVTNRLVDHKDIDLVL